MTASSVRLVPMSQDQFVSYRETGERAYAEDIAKSEMVSESEALDQAAATFSRLLPDGRDTNDQYLWSALDGGDEVGTLWLSLTEESDGLHAFVCDLVVPVGLRRRGYGRTILVAAEEFCREQGVVRIGLSVFGFNEGAQALYEAMGFQVAMLQLTKSL